MATLGIRNIGTLISGKVDDPVLDATAILATDGVITKIGGEDIFEGLSVDQMIDANGTTVTPGLLDSHVHPVLGDFTPRQNTLGFMDSGLHGGVTTMISAGEPHTPGRPKDPSGTKALALVCHKSSQNARPGGVKLHGGALILEKGLVEQDFIDLAAEGCFIVGEVGLGSVNSPETAAPMVEMAHKHGFVVQMHTGGTSIPGSTTVSAEDVIATNPDVVSHLNGGPTAISEAEVDKIVDQTDMFYELVQCGNFKVMQYAANKIKASGKLGNILLGNDAPSGTGVIPLGILRSISYLASMTDLSAAEAICCATGNTARAYRLNVGAIEVGKEADFVIMDAPMGSVGDNALEALEAGDLPGVSYVIIDGKILVKKSKHTPPAKVAPTI